MAKLDQPTDFARVAGPIAAPCGRLTHVHQIPAVTSPPGLPTRPLQYSRPAGQSSCNRATSSQPMAPLEMDRGRVSSR